MVHAQDAPLPSPDASAAPEASVAPTATPGATIPPPQLIPPDILPMPDQSTLTPPPPVLPTLEQLDEQLKPKPLSPAAEDYRLRIEWRKIRNRIENDASVRAALAATERAGSDVERRKLLAAYFNLFTDKAIAFAPGMKNYLNDRRRDYLGSLAQPRVRPSAFPSPTAKAKATATPAARSGLPSASVSPSPSPSKGR